MKKKYIPYIIGGISLVVLGGIFLMVNIKDTSSLPATVPPTGEIPEPSIPPLPPVVPTGYHTITLGTSNHGAQLTELVGAENVPAVLSLNRIDIRHLQDNQVLVVPDSFDDPFALSSFPRSIPSLASVPKMMFIAQKEQEFAAYEYGVLVRFGGISTGKKSTPTTNKLFYANWKGKEVISTSNDEWILKWNVNVDNFGGIGIHEYELPGYPASHSCVRLSASDARWFYDWVDQWILSEDDRVLASGTPVLIFGQYGFGQTAPWKMLAEDPKATTISLDSLEETLKPLLEEINQKQEQRAEVLGPKIEE